MKTYKLSARPVLSYGNEDWTIRKQDEWRLISAEMKFLRKNVGYFLLVHKRNELITEELEITSTAVQKKSPAAYKSKDTSQTIKPNVPLRPQRKMFKRETSKEMAGERKRPLGLLLQTKMMIPCIKNHLRLYKFFSYKSSALIK